MEHTHTYTYTYIPGCNTILNYSIIILNILYIYKNTDLNYLVKVSI